MSSPGEGGGPDLAPRTERDVSRDDLLGYLSRNTLDADYALVAERGRSRTDGTRVRVATAVVLAVFVVLVVTLFSQTTRNAASEDEERSELVSQVTAQRSDLRVRQQQVDELEASNDRLSDGSLSGAGGGVIGRVQRLGLLAGTIPATGQGILVEVDDSPDAVEATDRVLDSDLQTLVNGLWQAGAEAISINGQRLTTLSAIRLAGDAINVNFVGLSAPYRLKVLGNGDTLPSRFAETSSGATWFDLQRRVGLRFRTEQRSSLSLPAAETSPLRYAEATRR